MIGADYLGRRPDKGTILMVLLPFANVINTLNLLPMVLVFYYLVVFSFFCTLNLLMVLFLSLSMTLLVGMVADWVVFIVIFVK